TVQGVLDDLGAGEKPRIVVLNKADLIDPIAANPALPAPIVAGAVRVSATTGYGLDALRTELGALIGSLGVEVDLDIPYAAGELIARIRERGSVELEYGPTAVRVRGRVAPALAGELEAVAAAAGLLEEPAHA
ncbi:MAG: GTPase HflX, partial [Candidatus Limnocylindrales bacterium]